MKSVISIGTSKEAALYFDRVLPYGTNEYYLRDASTPSEIISQLIPSELNSPLARDVISSLIPDKDDAYDQFMFINIIDHILMSFELLRNDAVHEDILREAIGRHLEFLNRSSGLSVNTKKPLSNWRVTKRKLVRLRGSILSNTGFSSASLWSVEGRDNTSTVADRDLTKRFAMSLRNLNLVDASKLDWSEIVEFRKDKKSRSALRDLRVFFHEEFMDKEPEYISDKLSKLIDEYEEITKLWGFETVQKSLTVAFDDSKTLLGSAGVLAGALTSMSFPAAAAIAATVPLGKSALAFWKIAIDARRDRINRPVRYLTQLKKLSSK